ncbi:MAG: T9SS type A sorting domain-containing protein [Saprospiraceae bacterium]
MMSKLYLKLLIFLLCGGIFSSAHTQTTPSCNASTLSLQSLDRGTDGLLATFSLSPQPEVSDYQIRYQYLLAGVEMENILADIPELFTLKLASDTGQHRFTLINICLEGDLHTGSQLLLDFNNSSFECPIPSNLQIEDLDNTFVSFQWAPEDRALFWHVKYETADGFVQEFDTPEPFVNQDLRSSNTHLFTIYAVCDDQALIGNNTLARQSPAIQFMIVTVDDIKALRVSCEDLNKIVIKAYRLYCTKHGHFGPNKEAFLAAHNDCMPNALPADIDAIRQVRVFPNPTNDYISLSLVLNQAIWLQVDLLSPNGQLVETFTPSLRLLSGQSVLRFLVKECRPGLYWIRIRTNHHFMMKKILIMK